MSASALKRITSEFVVALVAAVVVGGCRGDGATTGTGGLEGRTFLSESVSTADASRPLVAGTQIRLAFFEESRLAAAAGCNTIGGRLTVNGNRLVLDDLAMTEMGCDPARHAQDEWLAELLTDGPFFRLEGDHLELRGGETVIRLIDHRVAE